MESCTLPIMNKLLHEFERGLQSMDPESQSQFPPPQHWAVIQPWYGDQLTAVMGRGFCELKHRTGHYSNHKDIWLWPVTQGNTCYLSYSHMGSMWLQTNFATENRVVTSITHHFQRNVLCIMLSNGSLVNHVFAAAAAASVFHSGSAATFCLICHTHRTAVHSTWPLLLKHYQSKM